MTTTITHARLVDGTGADPIDDTSVTIDNQRIVDIGAEPGSDDEVIDLQGRTLLPGIINAHSHLGGVAMLEEDTTPPGVVAAWIFEHCRRSLDMGITTCRETGGIDGGVPTAIEKRIVQGPRIIPAGPAIVQMGGHADFRPAWVHNPCVHHQGVPGIAILSQIASGPDQVRAAARLAFKRGAKFLKMCVTGGVTSLTDSLEDTQLSVEEIRAAVEEAKARGTYVTVHTHNNEGINHALEAGVECFEHATALDYETARAIARINGAIVPTLTVAEVYNEYNDFLPSDVIQRIKGVGAGMANAIRIAHEVGVLVGCGADLIGPDQKVWGLEAALVADVVGPMQALRTATLENAKVLRVDDTLGSVETGKLADLVAVDGDPLDDPKLLNQPESISLVMKAGICEKDRIR